MAKDTGKYSNGCLNLGGELWTFDRPLLMGILNINAQSFYDGGKYASAQAALKQALKMSEEGADIIDIGPASSKPGEPLISPQEEWQRLQPVLSLLKKEAPHLKLSLDSYNSETADRALNEGVLMINDISGGSFDPEMFKTVARYQVPYVLMHIKGKPEDMQSHSQYENLTKEIANYFHDKLAQLYSHGINDVILDPGFGFAKTMAQNYEIMAQLNYFVKSFDHPILVGISRKSMITKLLNISKEESLNATTVLNTMALQKGAQILRVHDVKAAQEAIRIHTFTQNLA